MAACIVCYYCIEMSVICVKSSSFVMEVAVMAVASVMCGWSIETMVHETVLLLN